MGAFGQIVLLHPPALPKPSLSLVSSRPLHKRATSTTHTYVDRWEVFLISLRGRTMGLRDPLPDYVFDNSAVDETGRHFKNLQVLYDPSTERHARALGVGRGWRCLRSAEGEGLSPGGSPPRSERPEKSW